MAVLPTALLGGWHAVLRRPKNRAALLAFQSRRLRQIVQHAYQRVPYYREVFDSVGLKPEDIRGVDGLPKIPLSSRADIQSLAPEQICAKGLDPDSLLVRRTSGSSGAPLTIRRQRWEERLLQVLRLRYTADHGPGWRSQRAEIGYSAGRTLWDTDSNPPLHQRLGFSRRFVVGWETPKDELIDRLASTRTEILVGAPSVLSWKADELTNADRERLHLRHVITGGETLTDDVRERLEHGWGAPVYDNYGSHEFVFIGNQRLDSDGYRICGESLIVEVLRDGKPVGPGEEGELVGTALHSFAMPFLRYRLGDLVRVGRDECPGDVSVRTLSRISGRTMDRFLLPGGRVVHPYKIANVLRDEELWVRRFQILQPEREQFHIRVVAHDRPSPERLAEVARRIEHPFAGSVSVHFQLVEDLPPTTGGKFHPYVSYERLHGGEIE
jgi:phenylacetate-CoA ligase